MSRTKFLGLRVVRVKFDVVLLQAHSGYIAVPGLSTKFLKITQILLYKMRCSLDVFVDYGQRPYIYTITNNGVIVVFMDPKESFLVGSLITVSYFDGIIDAAGQWCH